MFYTLHWYLQNNPCLRNTDEPLIFLSMRNCAIEQDLWRREFVPLVFHETLLWLLWWYCNNEDKKSPYIVLCRYQNLQKLIHLAQLFKCFKKRIINLEYSILIFRASINNTLPYKREPGHTKETRKNTLKIVRISKTATFIKMNHNFARSKTKRISLIPSPISKV